MSSWHALHFNKIAKVIREHRKAVTELEGVITVDRFEGKIALLDELTLEFAEYFTKHNEGFLPNKFIEACGWTER